MDAPPDDISLPDDVILLFKKPYYIIDFEPLVLVLPIYASRRLIVLEKQSAAVDARRLNSILDTGCSSTMMVGREALLDANYVHSPDLDRIFIGSEATLGAFKKRCENKFDGLVRLLPVPDDDGQPSSSPVSTVSGEDVSYSQGLHIHLLCNHGSYNGLLYPLNKEDGRIDVVDGASTPLIGINAIVNSGLFIIIETIRENDRPKAIMLRIYGPKI